MSVKTAAGRVVLLASEPHLCPDDNWRTSAGSASPEELPLSGVPVHTEPDESYWKMPGLS